MGLMESIYLGVRVVFPLLCFMLLGMVLRKTGWVAKKTFAELNKLVFRILLPTMLFLNATSVDLKQIFNRQNVTLLILSVISLAVIYVTSELISRRVIPDTQKKAIVIQGIYRSNLVLFGLPVSMAVYGSGELGTVSILIILIVPLYNIMASVLLGKAVNQAKGIGGTIKVAFSNPLVIGALLGIIFNLVIGTIPELLLTPMEQLGKMGTPLAFIVLGGSLAPARMKEELKTIINVCSLRLLVIPAVVLGIAMSLGIQGIALIALLSVFASPVSVSSYTMSKDLNICPELAGDLVAVTTLVSMLTMCGWITLFGYMNMI